MTDRTELDDGLERIIQRYATPNPDSERKPEQDEGPVSGEPDLASNRAGEGSSGRDRR